MALSVQTFEGGPVQTNAYLVGDDAAGEAFVVDAPQGVTAEIADAAAIAGMRIVLIVVTHPHWDHIADAAALQTATGAPIAAHPLAVEALAHPGSATMQLPFEIPPVAPDRLLEDGDIVQLGEHAFTVLHLPGHEPAHIALYDEPDHVLFGGDVLFPNGHGRLDIPGADAEAMRRSLIRLAAFPPDIVVYPGHGHPTTIGEETWLPRDE